MSNLPPAPPPLQPGPSTGAKKGQATLRSGEKASR